ncbi:MAG: DUF5675 family protein [Bacteroidota bacterium]|nr:DUF5675 family protein [Bacteroidota bacterium]
MEMQLVRRYHATGVNGQLSVMGVPLCFTIELPWLQNAPQRSCIPEGQYQLVKRYSQKFHWHLHLIDVPGREWILIHPANNALLELKGCIAPVTQLTAPGIGSQSRQALALLMDQADRAFLQQEPLLLIIGTAPLGQCL